VKRGVGKVDLSERAVFDLFRVGNGFGTPENEPKSGFYTASVDSGRSTAGPVQIDLRVSKVMSNS
jgi:hypothetical protein